MIYKFCFFEIQQKHFNVLTPCLNMPQKALKTFEELFCIVKRG